MTVKEFMDRQAESAQSKLEMIEELYQRKIRRIIWIYAAACVLVLAAGAFATMIMD